MIGSAAGRWGLPYLETVDDHPVAWRDPEEDSLPFARAEHKQVEQVGT